MPKTPIRSMRIPDEIWQAAQERAVERHESVTEAVIKFLKRYAKSPS